MTGAPVQGLLGGGCSGRQRQWGRKEGGFLAGGGTHQGTTAWPGRCQWRATMANDGRVLRGLAVALSPALRSLKRSFSLVKNHGRILGRAELGWERRLLSCASPVLSCPRTWTPRLASQR